MNTFSDAERRWIRSARLALAQSLEENAPPELLLPLSIAATVSAFVDIARVAGETPEIIGYINAQLEAAGLRLTSIRR